MFGFLKGRKADSRQADTAFAAVLARANLGGAEQRGEAWRAFAALSGRQILEIESLFRTWQWDFDPDSMRLLLAIASSEPDTDRAAAFRAAAACAADGRLREAALASMVMQPTRAEMAVAMIRTRDWVPQVREAADDALLEMFWSPDPGLIFELFELYLLLQRRKRDKSGQWQECFEAQLRGPANRERRVALGRHPSQEVRRAGIELQLQIDPDSRTETLLLAAADPAIGIALWALTQVRESSDVSLSEAAIEAALRHPHPSVRAQALRDRHAMHPDAGRLRASLFDRTRTIRNAAAYLLRTDFQEAATAIWRAALVGDQGSQIATVALLEHAEAGDLQWVKERLEDKSPRARSMALLALTKLSKDDLSPYLERAIADSSTLVTREAVKAYARRGERLDPQVLAAAYAGASSQSLRSSLLNAARTLGKWDALAFLSACAQAADELGFGQIKPHLDRWHWQSNRSFIALSEATRESLLPALAKAEHRHPLYSWGALRALL